MNGTKSLKCSPFQASTHYYKYIMIKEKGNDEKLSDASTMFSPPLCLKLQFDWYEIQLKIVWLCGQILDSPMTLSWWSHSCASWLSKLWEDENAEWNRKKKRMERQEGKLEKKKGR